MGRSAAAEWRTSGHKLGAGWELLTPPSTPPPPRCFFFNNFLLVELEFCFPWFYICFLPPALTANIRLQPTATCDPSCTTSNEKEIQNQWYTNAKRQKTKIGIQLPNFTNLYNIGFKLAFQRQRSATEEEDKLITGLWCKFPNAKILKYTNFHMQKYLNTRILKYPNFQIQKYTNMQTFD